MKKFISLFAALALSLTSVTAFAAAAGESDNIHVKLVADKATIAPGESVTISAFISANGDADVSFDTQAMFGLIFDMDNFTYEITNNGPFAIEDYSDSYGLLWASAEGESSFAANVACAEVKFTANADAAEDTYDFSVSADTIDTGFAHGLYLYDPDEGNVTLTDASVKVEKGQVDPITKKVADNGATVLEYAADYDGDKDLEGMYIVMSPDMADAGSLTAASRVVVTYHDDAHPELDKEVEYGKTIFAHLGITGEGAVNAKAIKFGVVYDNPEYQAEFFSFYIN